MVVAITGRHHRHQAVEPMSKVPVEARVRQSVVCVQSSLCVLAKCLVVAVQQSLLDVSIRFQDAAVRSRSDEIREVPISIRSVVLVHDELTSRALGNKHGVQTILPVYTAQSLPLPMEPHRGDVARVKQRP